MCCFVGEKKTTFPRLTLIPSQICIVFSCITWILIPRIERRSKKEVPWHLREFQLRQLHLHCWSSPGSFISTWSSSLAVGTSQGVLQPVAAARSNQLRGLEVLARGLGCLESSAQALHMRYVGHLTEAGNLLSHFMHCGLQWDSGKSVRWSNFQNRYFCEKALVQGEGIMNPRMEITGYFKEKGKNKGTK